MFHETLVRRKLLHLTRLPPVPLAICYQRDGGKHASSLQLCRGSDVRCFPSCSRRMRAPQSGWNQSNECKKKEKREKMSVNALSMSRGRRDCFSMFMHKIRCLSARTQRDTVVKSFSGWKRGNHTKAAHSE